MKMLFLSQTLSRNKATSVSMVEVVPVTESVRHSFRCGLEYLF
jgi:hypothetical protein